MNIVKLFAKYTLFYFGSLFTFTSWELVYLDRGSILFSIILTLILFTAGLNIYNHSRKYLLKTPTKEDDEFNKDGE